MPPADAADPNPSVPSFGLLGSSAAFLPIPVGNRTVKLARTVGNEVVYAAPPPGHGLGATKWERDALGGPNGYALKLPTAEVQGLVSLRHWRGVYAAAFPDGCVSNRNTPAARQLAEFARGLLTHTAALHRAGWRLGMASPDSVYLATTDPARVFLPDLGFAWVGQMALTKPGWLGADPTDAALWGEDRKLRQLAAPEQYRTRHPAAGGKPGLPVELVQQDLKVVGAVLGFMLAGKLGGPEPAGARRCPVWAVIRDANAGKFGGTEESAEQMLEAVLTGLKVPPDPTLTTPGGNQGKGGAGKRIALLALLLVLGGVAFAAWYFLLRPNDIAKGSGTGTPPTDAAPTTPGTDPTPATGPKPPDPQPKPPDPPPPEPPKNLPPLDPDLIDKARKDPRDKDVLAKLTELDALWNRFSAETRGGTAAHAAHAREVLEQIQQLQTARRPRPANP